MKQVVQNYKTGKLKIEEAPAPILKKGGVLVRSYYSLISAGTERSTLEMSKKSILGKAKARPDLVKQVITTAKKVGIKKTFDLVMNRLNAPVPLGYSLSGIVEEVSSEVIDINVGDFVACAGGGYASHAEKVFVPKNLIAKIPQGVSEKEASFTTVGSIALHGVRQAKVSVGDRVGVIGLGLVGQITSAILKAQGCKVLGIDLSKYVVKLSKKMGVDVALLRNNPGLINVIGDFTNEIGLDAVIITAGTASNDPFELAAEILRDKGTLVVVGGIRMEVIKSVSSPFYMKEIDIKFSRSYGPGRYDSNYEEKGVDYPIGYVRWTEKRNMECFLELLASKAVDIRPLITHTFPFEDALKAYELIEGKTKEPYLGILLEYSKDIKKEPERITVSQKIEARSGKIGIGIVGAGNFAQANILPYLKKNSDVILKGICTSKGMTAKSIAGKFGFSYCARDVNEILGDKEIDTIFIATRHDSHAKYVVEALNKGKHVYVEKPLCLNRKELNEIIKVRNTQYARRPTLLMVGYNRRFAPLSIRLKNFLSEINGPITVIYRINAGYIPRDNWYQDSSQGGRFIGEGCHFLDYGQFLTDSTPIQVSSYGISGKDKPLNLTDNLVVNVRMSNNSIVTVIYNSSGDSAMPKERVEVFGQNSSAVLDDFKSLQTFRSNKRKVFKHPSQDKGYKYEIDSYIKLLKEGGKALISFESLVATSLTSFAAIESLKRKLPIKVNDV